MANPEWTDPESQADYASRQAGLYVADMVHEHRAAAIPALIAACVDWAIMHGGGDVVRGSLQNAIKLSHDLERELARVRS